MRSFIGILITAAITLVISIPGVVSMAVFGDLMREPQLALALANDAFSLVLAAAITVFPSLLSGLVSGGLALIVVRRILVRLDVVMVTVGASVCVLTYLLMVPLLFPEPEEYPKIIEATASVLAYVLVARTSADLSPKPRRGLRMAWVVLVVALAVECAVIPMLMMEDLAARISAP